MKDHKSSGTFGLHIFGDWPTVVSVANDISRETGSEAVLNTLLDQKPWDDDDGAYYQRYSLRNNNAADLHGLFMRFRNAKLEVELFCELKSDIGATVFAATGTGWQRKEEPYFTVEVETERVSADMKKSIERAIKILRATV